MQDIRCIVQYVNNSSQPANVIELFSLFFFLTEFTSPLPPVPVPSMPIAVRHIPADTSMAPRLNGGDVSEARMMQMESRVSAAERANRALLEELIRWQSDLKSMSRKQDELRRDERRELLQLRANTATNNDDITEMSQKLQTLGGSLAEYSKGQRHLSDQLRRLQQMVGLFVLLEK